MRKVGILIFVITMLLNSLSAQDIINGYIIDKDTPLFTHISGVKNASLRFTPLIEDTNKADSIIISNKQYIRSLPRARDNGGVFKNSKKSFRQYVGIITTEGDRLILVNYVDKTHEITEENKSYLISVIDGGNGYWQALVNIDSKEIIEIYINGTI